MKYVIIFLLTFVAMNSFAQPPTPATVYEVELDPSGLIDFDPYLAGTQSDRDYWYCVPDDYNNLTDIPLLIVAHGANGDGPGYFNKIVQGQYNYKHFCNARGVAVVSIQGYNKYNGDPDEYYWACDVMINANLVQVYPKNHILYISAVIEDMLDNFNRIDSSRIYMSGSSQGASMTQEYTKRSFDGDTIEYPDQSGIYYYLYPIAGMAPLKAANVTMFGATAQGDIQTSIDFDVTKPFKAFILNEVLDNTVDHGRARMSNRIWIEEYFDAYGDLYENHHDNIFRERDTDNTVLNSVEEVLDNRWLEDYDSQSDPICQVKFYTTYNHNNVAQAVYHYYPTATVSGIEFIDIWDYISEHDAYVEE